MEKTTKDTLNVINLQMFGKVNQDMRCCKRTRETLFNFVILNIDYGSNFFPAYFIPLAWYKNKYSHKEKRY